MEFQALIDTQWAEQGDTFEAETTDELLAAVQAGDLAMITDPLSSDDPLPDVEPVSEEDGGGGYEITEPLPVEQWRLNGLPEPVAPPDPDPEPE